MQFKVYQKVHATKLHVVLNIFMKFHENLFESHKELKKQNININENTLELNQKIDNLLDENEKLESRLKACVCYFLSIFFPPNDGPSKTMKNVFCFIYKALFILKIFKFFPSFSHFPDS